MRGLKDSVSYITGPIVSEYSLILLFSTLGSSLLLSSGNLLSMYLSVELQSFGVYILATIYRNSESSTSAGLKYFLLGAFSSSLIIFGVSVLYGLFGTLNINEINLLCSLIDSSDMPLFFIANIFILAGILFKLGSAPFH